MKCDYTEIEGLVVITPRVFADDRGYFFESYNEAAFAAAGITCRFVQDNQSFSSYGVVRGLHGQVGAQAQAKLVRVTEGRVLDVAVDARVGSPTFGQHFALELSAENKKQIFIPRGFLHGFSVLSETAVLMYKCDNLYCKEAETGALYNDPALGIDWQVPTDKVRLSDKDAALGRFADAAHHRG